MVQLHLFSEVPLVILLTEAQNVYLLISVTSLILMPVSTVVVPKIPTEVQSSDCQGTMQNTQSTVYSCFNSELYDGRS